MTEANMKQVKIVDIIHFKDVAHMVYAFGDERLISMRPLVDQIGLDWRTQKKGLLDDDSILYYGTLLVDDGFVVHPPCKYTPKTGALPSHDSGNGAKIARFCAADAQKDTLLIRLSRVYMYLARISIGQVRGRGNNEESAQWLLEQHEEWGQALHDYETRGVAVKANHFQKADQRRKDIRAFLMACRQKEETSNARDRKALNALTGQLAEELGLPYQEELPCDEGNKA